MHVRPMRPDELERVIALWHETCQATYAFIPIERDRTLEDRAGFFRRHIAPSCEIFVALRGETLAGFLALRDAYIDRLYVHPGAQRAGTGRALLERARQHSPERLELHTHQRNLGARAFYERAGFQAVDFGLSPAPESEPDVEYHWYASG